MKLIIPIMYELMHGIPSEMVSGEATRFCSSFFWGINPHIHFDVAIADREFVHFRGTPVAIWFPQAPKFLRERTLVHFFTSAFPKTRGLCY